MATNSPIVCLCFLMSADIFSSILQLPNHDPKQLATFIILPPTSSSACYSSPLCPTSIARVSSPSTIIMAFNFRIIIMLYLAALRKNGGIDPEAQEDISRC